MAFGVTDTGFVEKTLTDIKKEIEDELKTTISPSLNTLADSVVGQNIGVMSGKLRELWEVALAVYRSMYPDTASGDALDNVAAITGAIRLAATNSTVTVTCTGTPTTALAVGRVLSTGAGDRFTSTAAATIAAATAWGGSTAYELSDKVTNDSNIYVCVQAGTSAASGGPTGTADNITDGACKWNFVGDGTGFADVPFQAEETGAVPCAAGAIDTEDGVGTIETPVSGWDDSRNLTDAVVGREIESDPDFRLRREQLVRATGNATVEAIRADVLAVTGVDTCFVYENTSLVTDGDGVPGKAFEVVCLTSTDGVGESGASLSSNAETYNLTDGWTLTVKVDGGSVQTATFNIGDFADINNALAAEVAAVINTDITGVVASVVQIGASKFVNIVSLTTGTNSSIEVTGGTANGALGFPVAIRTALDTAIAKAIFASGAAGIEPHGDINIVVEDCQGIFYKIGSSRPTDKPIHVIVDVTTDSDFPADGVAQIKAQIVAYGATLSIGDDVIQSQMYEYAFNVSGVVDVTKIWISFSDPPTGGANLTIGSREISSWQTTDVDVNVS